MNFHKNRKRFLVAVLSLLLSAGSLWGIKAWRAAWQLAKVQKLGEELSSDALKGLSKDEQRARWDEFYGEAQKLPPELRVRQVGRQLGRQWRDQGTRILTREELEELAKKNREDLDNLSPEQKAEREKERDTERNKRRQEGYEKFLNKSKEEQQAELDQRIDRDLAWAQRAGQRNGGVPSSPRTSTSRSANPDDRDNSRKKRLDASTPEYRAMRDEYYRQLNQRRQDRGLPTSTGRGRF